MSDHDRPFGQTNRGTNHIAGPDPEGYPAWYDNPEPYERAMPKAQQRTDLEAARRDRTAHRAACVDEEGSIDCVCFLGNPGDDLPPYLQPKENR